jgi:hypothetical protein
VSLDEWDCTCRVHEQCLDRKQRTSDRECVRTDKQVNRALNAAVRAFSVRWLPLVAGSSISGERLNSLARRLWSEARTTALSILHQRCYRSVLALYIFGMTPVPVGLEESTKAQGSIGEVCIDVAIRQIQHLQAKSDITQFSAATIVQRLSPGQLLLQKPDSRGDEGYQLRESIAAWAGFVFDTSASLTRGLPSILHAGVLGFDQDKTIRLLKETVQTFHNETETWRTQGFEVSDQRATWIIQSASRCKGMLWKAVACLREALTYRAGSSTVTRAQAAVLEVMQRYELTFAPLLAACRRALVFLDGEAQLNWCKTPMSDSQIRTKSRLTCFKII